MNVTLWILPVFLAVVFCGTRLVPLRPPASMFEQINASTAPAFRIFIGAAEVAAANWADRARHHPRPARVDPCGCRGADDRHG